MTIIYLTQDVAIGTGYLVQNTLNLSFKGQQLKNELVSPHPYVLLSDCD